MRLRPLVCFSFVVCACSGASATEVTDAPSPPTAESAGPGATAAPGPGPAPTAPAASADGGAGGPVTCDRPTTFYRDADGDGFGAAAGSQTACTNPGAGWVAVPGDCHDGNAEVFPGQKTYFGVGYMPATGSSLSFDYDCNGVEDEEVDPSGPGHFNGCNGMCKGEGGYAATPFRGPGTNPFCGSQTLSQCNSTSGTCKTRSFGAGVPIRCR